MTRASSDALTLDGGQLNEHGFEARKLRRSFHAALLIHIRHAETSDLY